MNPIKSKKAPHQVLIIAEQIITECLACDGNGYSIETNTEPECCGKPLPSGSCCGNAVPKEVPSAIPCEYCQAKGSAYEIIPEDRLTQFYNQLQTTISDFGFKVDHYGEKEAMIKRLTTQKAKSEYE